MSICKDEKKCPEGFQLNPTTGKCEPKPIEKTCPEGEIRDPVTGKCVKIETRKFEGQAISKNRLYVDRELVSGSGFIGYNVLDPIRDLTKHVWHSDIENLQTGEETDLFYYPGPYLNRQVMENIKKGYKGPPTQWYLEIGKSSRRLPDGSISDFTRTRINLIFKEYHSSQKPAGEKDRFKDAAEFSEFISAQMTTPLSAGPFYDHCFELEVPYDREDIQKFTIADSDHLVLKSNFEYNFQVPKYESLLSASKGRIAENILPNLYVIYSEYYNRKSEASPRQNVTPRFENLINVAGSLNISPKGRLPGEPYTVLSSKRIGAYFNRWSEQYPIDPPNDIARQNAYESKVKELVKNYSNTGYLSREAAQIESYKKYVELFPMFVQIKFPTDPGTETKPAKTTSNPNKNRIGFRGAGFTLPFTDAMTEAALGVPLTGHIMKTISQGSFPAHRDWTNLFLKLGEGTEIKVAQAKKYSGEQAPDWCSDAERAAGQCPNGGPGPAFRAWAKKKNPNYQTTAAKPDSSDLVGVPKTCSKFFVENENLIYKPAKPQKSLTTTAEELSFLDARVWNITEWWSEFNKVELSGQQVLEKGQKAIEVYDGKDMDVATFLGRYPLYLREIKNSKKYDVIKAISLNIFAGKARKIIDEHMRSFQDIYDKGKLAKSETVMYKISKYDAEDVRKKGNVIFADPIQNFYITNRTGEDVQEWVDTQVKYDKRYFYQIYAYVMVLGTEYKYEFDDDGAGKPKVIRYKPQTIGARYMAKGVAYHRPSIILVEVPYGSLEGVVVDSPPVAPQIEFYPQVDVNDEILIFMQSGIGDYYKVPIIVEPRDADLYDKMPKREEVVTSPTGELITIEKIRFKNDDPADRYICYRLEEMPTSYTDFSGEGEIIEPPSFANSAIKLDKIEPNKKYYYMFRVVDVHENYSYPSPVYEIEMEDEGGAYFLSIKIVEFSDGYVKSPVKGMKRYLHIKPSSAQRTIDERENNFEKYKSAFDVPKLTLGSADEKIFGTEKVPKRFKIRLTSKDTGKKIDLNLKFVHKHVNNKSKK